MEDILDILWFKIVAGVSYIVGLMDHILVPLNPLGPGWIILILVLLTVCFTKTFSRYYTTKRYLKLEKEFKHWYNLRREALSCEDREKGKALAKNIDQAKLNKVYYDFFFEGLLKNILTTYLPIFCMAAYVNETFRTDKMIEKFGREYVFRFSNNSAEPVVVGALFWFVISLLATYLIWYIAAKYYRKKIKTKK